jgi:hypothetical protein
MSTRDQRTGLIPHRAPLVFDVDIDDLEGAEAETKVHERINIVAVARRLAMKQELRELAKLAELMPIDRPWLTPPALEPWDDEARASEASIPPTVASIPPPSQGPPPLPSMARMPPLPPPPRLPTLAPTALPALPPWQGVFTPPSPEVAHPAADPFVQMAIPTPSFVAAVALPAETRGGRAAGWAALVGTLLAASLGGLLLGQALVSRTDGDPGSEPTAPIRAAAASMTAPAQTPHIAQPAVTAAAPAPAASAIVVTDPDDSTVTVRSPRPAHHAALRGPSRPPAGASARAESALKQSSGGKVHPPHGGSAGHDLFGE